MRKIGYLRVSTAGQSHDRQIDALAKLCDELFIETASAATKDRPEYKKAIRRLRRGDEFVVLDLDRAYRNTRDALNEFHMLDMRGIAMRVVNFAIDTRTDEGYYMFIVACGQGELERRVLSRRTKEGLAAARLRGKILGRPRKLSDGQIADAKRRLQACEVTRAELAREYRVGRWTLSRALDRDGAILETGTETS